MRLTGGTGFDASVVVVSLLPGPTPGCGTGVASPSCLRGEFHEVIPDVDDGARSFDENEFDLDLALTSSASKGFAEGVSRSFS